MITHRATQQFDTKVRRELGLGLTKDEIVAHTLYVEGRVHPMTYADFCIDKGYRFCLTPRDEYEFEMRGRPKKYLVYQKFGGVIAKLLTPRQSFAERLDPIVQRLENRGCKPLVLRAISDKHAAQMYTAAQEEV